MNFINLINLINFIIIPQKPSYKSKNARFGHFHKRRTCNPSLLRIGKFTQYGIPIQYKLLLFF